MHAIACDCHKHVWVLLYSFSIHNVCGILSICAVIVKAQDPPSNELVLCYGVESCTAAKFIGFATFSDCCDHSVDPVGFAYQRGGIEGCFACPVSKSLLSAYH